MRKERKYKDKLWEMNCSHCLEQSDVTCCQPRELALLLLWVPSFTSPDPSSLTEIGTWCPPQVMGEGCAQVLFFHIPFSDLNTYVTEDNILLMIKTVTLNHFSGIYFFSLLEVPVEHKDCQKSIRDVNLGCFSNHSQNEIIF